jgi:hypothetical protein
MYPLNPVVYTGVSPGDAITVSARYTGSAYALSLTDQTINAGFSISQSCPSGSSCKNKSAEVITEDPGASAPSVDLADFGQENYDGISVTARSGAVGTLAANSDWSSSQITMDDPSHLAMATPSPAYGGQAFSVLWDRAS